MGNKLTIGRHLLASGFAFVALWAGLSIGLQYSPLVGNILWAVAAAIFLGNLAWMVRSVMRRHSISILRWHLLAFVAALAAFVIGQGLIFLPAPAFSGIGSTLRLVGVAVILGNMLWMGWTLLRVPKDVPA